MNFYFYRIKLKGTDKFYAGPVNKPVHKSYEYNRKQCYYYINVTVGVYWRDSYFWSCKKKDTLKQHLEYIFAHSQYGLKDLEIEKCSVSETEILRETDIYSKYELPVILSYGKKEAQNGDN